MILGRGNVARVLPTSNKFLFFASGVSNSLCADPKEFKRERSLLLEQNTASHIVYFSSLSIFHKDSPYTRHKRDMEGMVKENFPKYCIVRLGNLAWDTNPNTLIQFLKDHPNAPIYDEYRYVITKDEFLHWISLIPEFPVEMNCPGDRLKVKEIKERYAN